MINISALLNSLMSFMTPDYYTKSHCFVPYLFSENVTLKPNSYWCHELVGRGIVRIVTDFAAKNARVFPMVLDSAGLEKCMKGEPYEPVELDGRTPITPQWSHNVPFYEDESNKKYYIVLRNEEEKEYSFGMLMYPS